MKRTVFVVGLMCAVNTLATLIDFNLKGDASIYSLLDNKASGSITNGSLIVTLTASDGVLNRTASGFGINGVGTDDTDALNTDQYIELLFSQDISFSSLSVSSWGANDAGVVQYGSSLEFQESMSGSGGDTVFGFDVGEGNTMRIKATADTSATNGFSVDKFSVVIPEPAVLGLIGLGGGLMILTRKRKNCSQSGGG